MATNFEGYSHQQLVAIKDALDPVAVKERADRLQKASEDIAKIGEKLKNHQVTGWEGEGAQAFQEWVSRTGNATLRLSEYSAAGAKWMGDTVQKMHDARAMPAYDTAAADNLAAARKAHNDPDARTIAQQEQSKLNADHRESVRVMNNLAQSYELSYGEMNKAEPPTFPPPPEVLLPQNVYGSEDMARSGGGSGGTGSGGSSHAQSVPEGSSDGPGRIPGHLAQLDSTPPPQTSSPTPTHQQEVPDRNVDLGLDHVATLPPPTTLPPTTGTPVPTLPVGPGPGPIAPIPPMPLPPVTGTRVPNIGSGGVRVPTVGPGSGLGKVHPIPGMPPRDTGIMGGRPVTTNGPGAGIPRGTVIGGEGMQGGRGPAGGTQAGRPMGGGMMGGAHGGGGAHAGGVGGSPAARRLASEPGGIVGGRPQPVAGGRSVPGGQPFTQGGSGLVRNGGSGGAAGVRPMGHPGAGAHAPGGRNEERGGERPDYLTEDEETWQSNRRVAPPVID